jgi:hypothetical protein
MGPTTVTTPTTATTTAATTAAASTHPLPLSTPRSVLELVAPLLPHLFRHANRSVVILSTTRRQLTHYPSHYTHYPCQLTLCPHAEHAEQVDDGTG